MALKKKTPKLRWRKIFNTNLSMGRGAGTSPTPPPKNEKYKRKQETNIKSVNLLFGIALIK